MKNDTTIPLIFLNLDILCTQSGQEYHLRTSNETHDLDGQKFCPRSIEGLDKIIQTYNAELVLLDPWLDSTESISNIKKLFSNRKLKWKVRDLNINSKKGIPRGKSIELWMKKHGTPERFVIIDDNADFDITPYFPGKTVNTNNVEGLADKRCYRRTNSIIKHIQLIEPSIVSKIKSVF